MGSTAISGLDMTLKVRETICISVPFACCTISHLEIRITGCSTAKHLPLDPVVVEMFYRVARTVKIVEFQQFGDADIIKVEGNEIELTLGLILTSYKMAFCSQGTRK